MSTSAWQSPRVPTVLHLEPLEVRLALTVDPLSLAAVNDDTASGGDVVISSDGRYVAFTSVATSIVAGQVDTNGARDVFLFDRTTGLYVLVSHALAGLDVTAGGESVVRYISADGGYVVFESRAADLVAGFVDQNGEPQHDLYLYETATGMVSLVSAQAGSTTIGGNGNSFARALSDDGRYLIIDSSATNLVSGFVDRNGPGMSDAYLCDLVSRAIVLVSRQAGSTTAGGNGISNGRGMSADGRYLIIETSATDLVAGISDANGANQDAYLYDRVADTTRLVSHRYDSMTTTGDSQTLARAISADGSTIALESRARDLISSFNDDNTVTQADIYAYARATQAISLVSHSASQMNESGNNASFFQSISATGQFIAFESAATTLVAGFSNINSTARDIYSWDRSTNTSKLASRSTTSATQTGTAGSAFQSMTTSGRYIYYSSNASNLVASFVDGNASGVDIYRFDVTLGTTALVSHASSALATGANGTTTVARTSASGDYVALVSAATNLAGGVVDHDTAADVFLHTTASNSSALVSRRAAGAAEALAGAVDNVLRTSDDGRYVAFASTSIDVLASFVDGNASGSDVYLYDRDLQTTILVSRSAASPLTSGNGAAQLVDISSDGRYVLYTSSATNAIAGQTDSNGGTDVFVYDVLLGTTRLVSRQSGSTTTTAAGASIAIAISDDGRVLFESAAANLVAGVTDSNAATDVFLFDLATELVTLVSHAAGSTTTTANAASTAHALSADGRYVAFGSRASNVIAGMTRLTGDEDVYLFALQTQGNVLVSRSAAAPTTGSNARAQATSISDDGSIVVFQTIASNVASGVTDVNGVNDVFYFDRTAGTVGVASLADGGSQTGDEASSGGRTSGDGRYIVFASLATNIASGQIDSSTTSDIFLFDRQTTARTLVSHAQGSPATAANGESTLAVISRDGSTIALVSRANNLIAGMTGNDFASIDNVYAYAVDSGSITLASHALSGESASANGSATAIALAEDGGDVFFVSTAGNLTTGDGNASADAFVFTSSAVATPPPSTPDLDPASDTGVLNSDDLTYDATPTFAGTSVADAVIDLYSDRDGHLGSTIASAAGVWSFTPSTMLSSGAHAITATATAPAQSTSVASSPLAIIIDTSTTVSTPDLVAASDSGSSPTDNITSDTTPTFTGTAEAGVAVELWEGTTLLGSTIATGGSWSITSSLLSSGGHSVFARATDAAGNVFDSAPFAITVDTSTSISTPDLAAASDLGVSDTDDLTSDTTPTFTGAAEIGATVELWEGTTLLGSTLAADGTWSITTSALGSGGHTVFARATDTAGNSLDSAPINITIDNATTASTPDLEAASDSGSSSIDDITSDTTPTFTGTAEVGATVELWTGTTLLGSTVATSGSWSITSIALAAGGHSIFARASDAAGNIFDSTALSITIDTSTTVSTPDLETASDSGSSPTDNITSDTTPSFTGTAEAGVAIELWEGTTLLGSTIATGGSWSITSSALSTGGHNVFARATDAAGNVFDSAALAITIDTSTSVTTPDLAAASDLGVSDTDDLTSDTTPAFTGTAEVGATVELWEGTTLLGSTIAADGTWSITASALGSGGHAVFARATDIAGNSLDSAPINITIDNSTTASTPDLEAASDSGSSPIDNITSDTTPAFTGTAEVGATVELWSDTTLLGSTVATSGSWSITSSALAAGDYDLLTRASDAAGNTFDSAPLSITIDIATTVSAPDLEAASDSGASPTDDITRDTTPTFAGTAETGVAVELWEGTTLLGSAIATGGTWSITSSLLSAGGHSIFARATDAAGNVFDSATLTITIDTSTSVSTPDLAAASDSGVSDSDDLTSDTTPTFTGTAEIGATVELWEGTTLLGSTLAADGTWSITASTLADGDHSVFARAIDTAGNALDSAPLSITITTGVFSSTPDLAAASDSGSSPTDDVTSDATPAFSGTADDGATIELWHGTTLLGAATASGGAWSITSSALADGVYNIFARASDGAGNTFDSAALFVTIDTSTTAGGLALAAASDTGASASDRITLDDTPTISGTAEVGALVELYEGSTLLGSVTAADGTWSLTSIALAAGTHELFARATDAAGNTFDSSPLSITIDLLTTVSTPDLAATSDSGDSSIDDLTSDATPTLSGTAESGATIELWAGSTLLGTTTATGGVWSITSAALAAGSHTLFATATDLAGNTATSSTLTIEIDLSVSTSAPQLAAASDTGSSPSDQVTAATSLTLAGTADIGAIVELYDGANLVGTTTVSSGSWSFTIGPVASGLHSFTSMVRDAAGNTASSAALVVLVDTTGPAASLFQAPSVSAASPTGSYDFQLTFADAGGIDAAAFGGPVTVTGPGGFTALAVLVGLDANTNGPARIATYRITPPGGAWEASDAGTYSIAMAGGVAFDVAGNASAAVAVGSFTATFANWIVTAADANAKPRVVIRDAASKQIVASFLAYSPSFRGGVRVAQGDVNGDGTVDIIVAPGAGMKSQVKVIDGRRLGLVDGRGVIANAALIAAWNAFPKGYRSGVHVAAGDLNGDLASEIVIGSGGHRKNEVRIYDGKTFALAAAFRAFRSSYRGGVQIAVGDLLGDSRSEIVVGQASGKSDVRVFDVASLSIVRSLRAFGNSYTRGVNIALGDLDGDDRLEILVGAGLGEARIKALRASDLETVASFRAFPSKYKSGVRVGSVDIDGDGRDEILAALGRNSPPHLRTLRWTSELVDQVFAFSKRFRNGFYLD